MKDNYLKIAFLLICFFMFNFVSAQERTITGTVTGADDKLSLPGVSIVVKGTTAGTQSGATGQFSLRIPNNKAVLVFSYVGYTSQEVAVGQKSTIYVALAADATQLGEVVVTALGITRNRNEVAYSAQKVEGNEVSKTRSGNFITGMSGKVAGLEIRQNNAIGASSNVVLRGVKSITGNNQALFVIDGVPVNNANSGNRQVTDNSGVSTRNDQSTGRGGYDYGNAVADMNPDNIESISVLKGAAASALYGSQGSNGVILITTKKGQKGLGIAVNSSISVGSYDKSTFPKYQHKYGGGYGAYYGPNEDAFFNSEDVNGDGVLDLVVPFGEDASYGGAFDPNLLVYQWDAFDATSPNFGKATPWVAAKNDPSSIFITPVSNNQSIFINGGTDKGTYKLGFTRNDERGIMPNSKIVKNVLDFSSSYNITPKLTAAASVNYSNVNGLGRYGTGYDGDGGRNLMTNFRQWYQVNADVQSLKDAYDRTGSNVTWNRKSVSNGAPSYWDNPYFVRYENFSTDTRDRYFGNVNLNYKVADWFSILGRVAVDYYTELQEERKAVGTIGVSGYSRYDHTWRETNYDLIANFNTGISDNLEFKGLLGTNIRKQHDQSIQAQTNGGLIVKDIYALSNSVSAPVAPNEYDGKREVDGYFAGATFVWNKMVTLDGTLRADQSSTLPAKNNSYLYPSVSGGFVFSELLKTDWLSYGKVRANYAEVGNDAPIGSILDTYNIIAPFGSAAQASVRSIKNNPDLKPERTKSTEAGFELAFFKSRLGLDATYYRTLTVNQILPVTVSTSTGYDSKYLNSGKVRNTGLELTLNGTPIVSNGFTWKVDVNWTRNRNKVTELFKDATGNDALNLQLATFQGGISSNATLGQPFGVLRGSNFVYVDGEKLINPNGRYAISPTSNEQIADPNAKWLGGINNRFSYKNVALSFLIDIRHGGQVFSTDMYYGLATGLYEETAGLNDLGNPLRNTLADGGGIIREGVLADGTPNTIRAAANTYGAYGYRYSPAAAFVYDASYVKLREAMLTYTLPQSAVTTLGPVKGVDLSLIGRNLWIIHKNLPYADPEDGLSAGNFQGYQVGSYPTTRTLTFNVKLTF
ncbi:TonB-dependent receptor [Arcticibacter svalbardensis MN12-7]|uniref:TonB-dependent receptor n=2 Tax=Arcticibacter TaxID=1288026 RepID=R9H5V3_9SPHI|nr:TonB-dependent receptor [Arcticibacter svalbardensis MN12-7]